MHSNKLYIVGNKKNSSNLYNQFKQNRYDINMFWVTFMITDGLHIYWMKAFSVDKIWVIMRGGFYSHMGAINAANRTRETSNAKKTMFDFAHLPLLGT